MSNKFRFLACAMMAAALGVAGAARSEIIDFEAYAGSPPGDLTVPTSFGDVVFSGGDIETDLSNAPADESTVYYTSFFYGTSEALTLTFSQPINNFFLDLYNGQTYDETYTVSDNAGRSTVVTIPSNTDSGTSLISFPAIGNVITITTTDPDFDFFIDNVGFNQATPGAPEPAAWALMISGIATAGSALRRSRRRRSPMIEA